MIIKTSPAFAPLLMVRHSREEPVLDLIGDGNPVDKYSFYSSACAGMTTERPS